MKKLFLFICLFSLFLSVGCSEDNVNDTPTDGEQNNNDGGDDTTNQEDKKQEFAEFISKCDALLIDGTTISNDIDFVTSVTVDEVLVTISYSSSNQTVLSNQGKVTLPIEEDEKVTVTMQYSFYKEDGTLHESDQKVVEFTVVSVNTLLGNIAKTIEVPSYINDDVKLPNEIEDIEVEWSSNNKCLSSAGKYKYVSNDTNVVLTATLIYEYEGETIFFDKEFEVVVGPYEDSKCVELVAAKVTMPSEFSGITLPYVTENDYDATITWSSTDPNVDANGKLINLTGDKTVKVTAKITKGEAEEILNFDVLVKYYKTNHMFVLEVSDFEGTYENTEVSNGKLVLKAGQTEGTFISEEYAVRDFTELVGSWNALTNTKATCEYAISVKSNGVWSKYFTYGDWGLGKTNYYSNQDDTYVKMNTDEILMKNSNVGTAVKFKVTLRRDAAATESPKLARIAMTFLYKNYSYYVDASKLPASADYVVPRLYQYDVPTIGGSICSPTTTSMLLKYHGVDLSSSYQYEHQYMANLVADPGHNNPTYGNWSYNMAAAGAFGRKAYVMKMYSWEELQQYLAYNGPVGASIKGTFPGIKEDGSSYSYTTGGHLICVRGYRIENGKTTVIINDPAVKGTYYEVSLTTFMNCWRDTVYIVE